MNEGRTYNNKMMKLIFLKGGSGLTGLAEAAEAVEEPGKVRSFWGRSFLK